VFGFLPPCRASRRVASRSRGPLPVVTRDFLVVVVKTAITFVAMSNIEEVCPVPAASRCQYFDPFLAVRADDVKHGKVLL
jgi:hypothetical protein